MGATQSNCDSSPPPPPPPLLAPSPPSLDAPAKSSTESLPLDDGISSIADAVDKIAGEAVPCPGPFEAFSMDARRLVLVRFLEWYTHHLYTTTGWTFCWIVLFFIVFRFSLAVSTPFSLFWRAFAFWRTFFLPFLTTQLFADPIIIIQSSIFVLFFTG